MKKTILIFISFLAIACAKENEKGQIKQNQVLPLCDQNFSNRDCYVKVCGNRAEIVVMLQGFVVSKGQVFTTDGVHEVESAGLPLCLIEIDYPVVREFNFTGFDPIEE